MPASATSAITYTEARNNLAAELDRVNDDDDVTLITRQKSAAAVLMSLKEYESLMETAHLLGLFLSHHPAHELLYRELTLELGR